MKTTIRDIAERAGVSAATVSNALNGRKGVSENMRQFIEKMAKEMNYEYEPLRQSKRNYVRLVVFKRHGLVVMDTQFFMELMDGIERECHVNGLDLMITNIHMKHNSDYLERVKGICKEECAGLILLATEMYAEDMRLFAATASPLLVLDSLFPHLHFNTVAIDNYDAGFMATQHLINMGHTRIAHITSSARFQNMGYRRSGYEAAMRANHLEQHIDYSWRVTPTVEGAYQDVLKHIDAMGDKKPASAYFIANDIIAVGASRAFTERGFKVPRDVSLIGMDDLSICQINTPPLSTIRVLRREMARVAVRRLVELADSQQPGCIQRTEICVELVERTSIADLRNI